MHAACLVMSCMQNKFSSAHKQSNRTLTRITGSGRGHSDVGLDRGTKKSLLVESFESLPVYFGIV